LRLLHPTLINVAKMPEQTTLLLNIGNGVFCLADKEIIMYVPDTLKRMEEEATLKFLNELIDDDGSPIKCEFCDEDAVDGLAIYNPADALRDPPVTGIYATLIRCEDCRDNGYGEDDIFWCEDCGETFIVNHSWDVVASMGEHGWECQKCFAEKLEGVELGYVLQDLRDGETGRFKRINSYILWDVHKFISFCLNLQNYLT